MTERVENNPLYLDQTLTSQVGERGEEPRWHDFLEKQNREADLFWKGKPPEEIIIATGSVRKAMMAIHMIYEGLVPIIHGETPEFDEVSPMDLQEYFKENILNSNGH